MSVLEKHCVYCHRLFEPDLRVGGRQKACCKTRCRSGRKKEAQKQFMKNNPTYFRGRYKHTKAWLKNHPGYLAEYRKTHPKHMEKKRAQDRLRRREQKGRRADIQDTIRLKVDGVLSVLGGAERADIQVSNAISGLAP